MIRDCWSCSCIYLANPYDERLPAWCPTCEIAQARRDRALVEKQVLTQLDLEDAP